MLCFRHLAATADGAGRVRSSAPWLGIFGAFGSKKEVFCSRILLFVVFGSENGVFCSRIALRENLMYEPKACSRLLPAAPPPRGGVWGEGNVGRLSDYLYEKQAPAIAEACFEWR